MSTAARTSRAKSKPGEVEGVRRVTLTELVAFTASVFPPSATGDTAGHPHADKNGAVAGITAPSRTGHTKQDLPWTRRVVGPQVTGGAATHLPATFWVRAVRPGVFFGGSCCPGRTADSQCASPAALPARRHGTVGRGLSHGAGECPVCAHHLVEPGQTPSAPCRAYLLEPEQAGRSRQRDAAVAGGTEVSASGPHGRQGPLGLAQQEW